ncbi:hypothetical protein [Thalassospira xiamenensis]|uniref:hypothetical protein n=1 Tax=Thalassospira xiamenensis TaxID=220697 RepID=UPI0014839D4F|nr:hypothetical protein [Thalassospira xiamenensis]
MTEWANLAAWVGAVTGVFALAPSIIQFIWKLSDRRESHWPQISVHHSAGSRLFDFNYTVVTIRNRRDFDYKLSSIFLTDNYDLCIEVLRTEPENIINYEESVGGRVEFLSSEIIKPDQEVNLYLSAYSEKDGDLVGESVLTGSFDIPAVECTLRLISNSSGKMKWYKFNCAARNCFIDLTHK